MPGVQQFTDMMKLQGIKKSTRVVLYDKGTGVYATRIYWMLRTYGHENASVLNGGFKKWTAEGRRVVSSLGFETDSTDGFDYAFNADLYRYFEQVQVLSANIVAGTSQEQLSDARPKTSYDAGHIPGAINVFYQTLQNADGTIKTPAEIRSIALSNGIDLTRPQVVSCGTGITASWLFASYQHAGSQQTALYDGSWQEWSDRTKT